MTSCHGVDASSILVASAIFIDVIIQNNTESINRFPPTAVRPPTPGHDPMRLQTHEVYFKVHKLFDVPHLDKFCRELIKQVNLVYSKTTNRIFKYEGFELVDSSPTWGSASFKLPSKGFKIVVYLDLMQNSNTKGSSLIQGDDIIVICNLSGLPEIPTTLNVNVICHEIAHGFGVAIGEYYSIKTLTDFTGISPEYKVSSILSNDDYWHTPSHLDWIDDPMLSINPINPKFCWLSSYIINSGEHRNGQLKLPDLFNVRIKFDITLDPSWNVKIWRNSKSFYDEIGTYHVDLNGIVIFPWNAGQNNHWTEALSDNFRIIKIFNNETHIKSFGISIWDVEESYIKSKFSSLYEVVLK